MVLYGQEGSWRVRIKAHAERLDLPLSSGELDDALLEAEALYADARALTNGDPRCFQCVHWEPRPAECGLDFPEGRSSGGTYAKHCAAYWSAASRADSH
jgi:hypothetical protein